MKQIAIKAAKEAGKILLRYYKKPRSSQKIHAKSEFDVGASADIVAEKAVLKIIKKAYPDHHINAEESGENIKKSQYTWYIDALDGTINFTRRIPLWCVSIGLTKNGTPVLGVVYDPIHNELFVAEKGKKTTKNGKRIVASKVKKFHDAIIGTTYTTRKKDRPGFLKLLEKYKNVYGIRMYHATSLALAYIAEGRIDAYIKNTIHFEDLVAGGMLVLQAGGTVTDLKGNKWSPAMKNVYAGPKHIRK